MRCEDVQLRISDSLDGGRPLDGEARRHVEHCTACAAFERDCGALDLMLAAGRGNAPPVPQPRRWIRIVPVVSALAAAVIVLALLPFWRAGRPQRSTPPMPRQEPLPPIALNVPDLGQVAETVALAPMRKELASLATDARSATRSILSCLPSPPAGGWTQTAPSQSGRDGGNAI